MLCRLLFGHHSCLALSMFSLIPAFVITGIMDKWVMKGKSAMDRMALAGMTLTCVMFLGTMIVLRMDMLMCMFIVLALWTFYRMYSGDGARRSDSVMLPVWIFLVALIAVAAITLAVVTLQSWRAASANPIESLKNE